MHSGKMTKALEKRVLLQAQAGNVDELRKIMFQGSIIWMNCRLPTGDTPLHVAAQYGMDDVVRFLLDEWVVVGKNYVDIRSSSGKTALHEAAQFAKPSTISLLLQRGANARALKQADWTPLMLACTKKGMGALECCNLLYRAGGQGTLADQNKDGWTAFHVAVREGDTNIIKWFFSLQPDLCTTHSKNGRFPLHTAALHGHTEVVSLLLDSSDINPNTRDSCGSTPVHDAVRSGSIEAVQYLISRGGDVHLLNALGQSAVHMAAETGDDAVLEYLLKECSLKTDAGSFNCTPLHCAIKGGKTKAVRTLLRHNANPRALDSCGYSCLDIARTSKCSATLDLIEVALISKKTEDTNVLS